MEPEEGFFFKPILLTKINNAMKTNYNSFLSDNSKNIPTSFLREILETACQPGMISFAGGLPNSDFFPIEGFRIAIEKVLSSEGRSILQYSGSQGFHPLREWIAQRNNSKYSLKLKPENLLVTNGSQQALDIISKILINPGDPILLEKPSYLGAIQAFSAYSPRFIQIDMEGDGIHVDELENVFITLRPKVLYSISNFQNPTGISYSLEKRIKIAELLDTYDALLIEDDPYNEVRFEGKILPPIYFFNPDRVIWCGSFSKMLSPGIRTGWICAPDQLMPHLLRAKQSTDLHTNNLVQRMIYSFVQENDIERHLASIKEAYKKQKDIMREMIAQYFPNETITTNPEGGMFLWATLPEEYNTQLLVETAINRKVVFVPGSSFYTNGEGQRSMRLNYSNSNPSNIKKGIQRLGEVIQSYPLALKT